MHFYPPKKSQNFWSRSLFFSGPYFFLVMESRNLESRNPGIHIRKKVIRWKKVIRLPAQPWQPNSTKNWLSGVPFEKNMKKSKFVIVEFLNQYKVRYNQTNLIILKILSVILKSKNIKILLFFIWILNQ